ncbi:hypothetical protein N7463_010669 [Penicillium fimorum]|uniref:Uncharacterized protein n=1 Tax=Penicillium fimorum TaxID=1882269 RepID=A0A9W9XKD4_9EURO|nr:hypothetical protein N7463_010669 [Penicillium fimorum]
MSIRRQEHAVSKLNRLWIEMAYWRNDISFCTITNIVVFHPKSGPKALQIMDKPDVHHLNVHAYSVDEKLGRLTDNGSVESNLLLSSVWHDFLRNDFTQARAISNIHS